MTTEYLNKHNIEMVEWTDSLDTVGEKPDAEEAFVYRGSLAFIKDKETGDIRVDSLIGRDFTYITQEDQTAFLAALRTLMYGTPTNPEAEVVKVYGNPSYVQVPLPIFDDPNE